MSVFNGETERAQRLALDKPRYWEYLLVEELLRSNLICVRRDMEDVKRGLKRKPLQHLADTEFTRFLHLKFGEIRKLMQLFTSVWGEQLPASWGEPGQPGDPVRIKRAVDVLISGCERLVEWELDLRSVAPSAIFRPLHRKVYGWAEQMLAQTEEMPDRVAGPFKQPNPSGTYEINLVFEGPANAEEVMAEMDLLCMQFDLMAEDSDDF